MGVCARESVCVTARERYVARETDRKRQRDRENAQRQQPRQRMGMRHKHRRRHRKCVCRSVCQKYVRVCVRVSVRWCPWRAHGNPTTWLAWGSIVTQPLKVNSTRCRCLIERQRGHPNMRGKTRGACPHSLGWWVGGGGGGAGASKGRGRQPGSHTTALHQCAGPRGPAN